MAVTGVAVGAAVAPRKTREANLTRDQFGQLSTDGLLRCRNSKAHLQGLHQLSNVVGVNTTRPLMNPKKKRDSVKANLASNRPDLKMKVAPSSSGGRDCQ